MYRDEDKLYLGDNYIEHRFDLMKDDKKVATRSISSQNIKVGSSTTKLEKPAEIFSSDINKRIVRDNAKLIDVMGIPATSSRMIAQRWNFDDNMVKNNSTSSIYERTYIAVWLNEEHRHKACGTAEGVTCNHEDGANHTVIDKWIEVATYSHLNYDNSAFERIFLLAIDVASIYEEGNF